MTKDFQYEDENWAEGDWRDLMERLVEQRLVTWKDVTTLTLGQMNPSQVGTSLASSEGFQRRYGKGNTMRAVMDWFYRQDGTCISCGTRVEHQVDHIVPKETIQRAGVELAEARGTTPEHRQHIIVDAIEGELIRNEDRDKVSEEFIRELAAEAAAVLEEDLSPQELRKQLAFVADRLDNLGIRCRRCNVIRRPSHRRYGGVTYQTAESALMWLLVSFQPRTLRDYIRMCRLYGMTMADVRMAEGWAMSHWLQHAADVDYKIDDGTRPCSILLWPEDGAITRAWPEDEVRGAAVLYEDVLPKEDLCLIAAEPRDADHRVTAFRLQVGDLPFSHYFKGSDQPPQALSVTYSAPKRSDGDLEEVLIGPLPPRDMHLVAHAIVEGDSAIHAAVSTGTGKTCSKDLQSGSKRAKLCDYEGAPHALVGSISVK